VRLIPLQQSQHQVFVIKMGCGGSKSKANAPKAAETTTKSTLLDAPAAKEASVAAPVAAGNFIILIDGLGASKCLVPVADAPMLRVEDVETGPIALWNNRARTDYPNNIVKKGDLVVKVKKVGQTEEVGGDAKLMLQALVPVGPFEVEVKSATSQEAAPEPVQEAPVATAVEAPAAPVTAPVADEVKAVEEPEKAVEEPVKAVEEPERAVEEPVMAVEEVAAPESACKVCC